MDSIYNLRNGRLDRITGRCGQSEPSSRPGPEHQSRYSENRCVAQRPGGWGWLQLSKAILGLKNAARNILRLDRCERGPW